MTTRRPCIAVTMLCSLFALGSSDYFVRSLKSTTSSWSERKPSIMCKA